MDIYLIRHGQSTGNGLSRFCGWSEHPLTDLGRRQAEAVASRLSTLGTATIICSDLCRARTNAEVIAEQMGTPIRCDKRWRELNNGAFEGRLWDEFSRDEILVRAFEDDPFTAVMPEGESAALLCERVHKAFDELCGGDEETVIVVTHDGPIRAVLAYCLAIPPSHFWKFRTDHGGLTRILLKDSWLTVQTMNDTSHLSWGDGLRPVTK